MMERYRVLAANVRREVSLLEGVVARAARAASEARRAVTDTDVFLDAAALNLHGFYSGLERIFLWIARDVDERVPEGADWHRELLRQMTLEVPKVRPAVISEKAFEWLDEYRGFRHVVRNVYAFQFKPDRLQALASQLRPAFQLVREEILAFADFLESQAEE